MDQKVVFIWLTGHKRNVGDSMLRRPYAEVLSEASPIRVWAGDPRSGYARGLGLDTTQLAPRFAVWYAEFVKAAIAGRASFAFNPGEFGVTRAYFIGMVLLLPWLLLAKARGGKIIWIGAAIASSRRGLFWPFRVLAHLSDLLYWRDNKSALITGLGAQRPDWGFALRSGGALATDSEMGTANIQEFENREYVGISLRGDRPYPSQEWLDAIRDFCTENGYRVITISQVEDDSEYAGRIANELGGDALLWDGGDHFVQEQQVRSAYQKCAAVFSDRLHGLIIASTEHAVPFGWVEAATDKLARHLDVVGAHWAVSSGHSVRQIRDLTRNDVQRYFTENAQVVESAREQLGVVMSEMHHLLTSGKSGSQ